ncbi:beta-galactosidase [Isoptericola halotolerans]|uniref:Glycoside hydrolase 35 catalytic domain-containing protein n=1 Tax=Isoptericola halotolerans TaxID=300560 RepID=A0ABX1ZY61_9MICO|nr:hypothetical protein [Isoptericola halotolerans]
MPHADHIDVALAWIGRAGRPWFPVTGEVHYARLPRERWSEVLGHARAGGLTSVATYVFWQAHEPTPGELRWDGNLDLRAFVELAGRHGLEVVVRLGPWAHGEARYGGFPDWLVESDLALRTDDPGYLALVRRFYGATIDQLAGLTHADGGPVVGAQIENELYDQPEHLATLRKIAEEAGLHLPLWTATGWGGALVPEGLLPVYSAYADGFWAEADEEWPSWSQVHFRYSPVRDDLGTGADVREALDGVVTDGGVTVDDGGAAGEVQDPGTPFITCELGGGMHVAYHRRPLVQPADVAALALAKIGSGSVWQGYYVYAGGTQRVGAHGTEQESQATGYPNDVPTLSYDFGAPVGEHGQVRPHHHLLRRQHLWLACDGEALAAMPATVGGGSDDPAELRWAVRSDGRRGYLFVTTYQPARAPLPAQPGVQLTVDLDDGPVIVPTAPVDLPAGVSVAWPLRYPLADGVVLRSATAQLVTRLDDVVVLAATEGVPVELVLDGEVAVGGPVTTRAADGATVVTLDVPPGPGTVVELPGVRVMVLDDVTADRLYRLELAGRERLALADAPVYALDGELVVHGDRPQAEVSLLPGTDVAVAGARGAARGGGWVTWEVHLPGAGTHELEVDPRPVAPAPPEPTRGGPMDRLSAPTDFSGAARVHLEVPAEALAGVDRALLRLDWTGDVGRALVGDEVVGDHFWHGPDWDVDLTPWREEVARDGLTLELLPWRRDTGVWVDLSVRDVPDGIAVRSASVVRVARAVVEVAAVSRAGRQARSTRAT